MKTSSQIRYDENGVKRKSFGKYDKLLPVVTVVVHLGTEKWDGAVDLYGCFKDVDERIKEFIPNYKMNLVSPISMEREQFQSYTSRLGSVFEIINAAIDEDTLYDLVSENPKYQNIDRESASLIDSVLGLKLSIPKEQEGVNMCEAVKKLREKGIAEGIEVGREKGIEKGEENILRKMKEMTPDELKDFLSKNGIEIDDTPDFTRGFGR